MSGIARAREKMKRKMSFGDYAQKEEEKVEKTKRVYCLPNDSASKLKEIFSRRVQWDANVSIPDLITEAIQLLYTREMPR